MADRVQNDRFPILTGYPSRRAAGIRLELQRRAADAYAASLFAEDERGAAALRGKARGLREAVDLVRALETGRRIGGRRRRNKKDPHDNLGELARSVCTECGDAYWECSKCGVYFCACSRPTDCPADSTSPALESAE